MLYSAIKNTTMYVVLFYLCRSTGFILEGFPSTDDELQLLCNKGLFPDAAVILHLESKHIVERILPGKMENWNRKRKSC